MKESELGKLIQLKASELGARLFRNNIGKGWIGKSVTIMQNTTLTLFPGDVVIRQARRLHFGLGKGSSDYIGFIPVEITPDMVGQKFAIFTAVETKVGKYKTTPEQDAFINMVNNNGGRGVVLRDVEHISNEIRGIKTNAGGKF